MGWIENIVNYVIVICLALFIIAFFVLWLYTNLVLPLMNKFRKTDLKVVTIIEDTKNLLK